MRIIQTWVETDFSDKEIRSSDNKDVGHAKSVNGTSAEMLASVKGTRLFYIPREAIATYDGEKIYLRATEAEVLAGVYPFIDEKDCNCSCHDHANETHVEPTKAI